MERLNYAMVDFDGEVHWVASTIVAKLGKDTTAHGLTHPKINVLGVLAYLSFSSFSLSFFIFTMLEVDEVCSLASRSS